MFPLDGDREVKHPYRLYLQLLKLWWRQTDCTESQAGPTIVGRLKGTALQIALNMTADSYDEENRVPRLELLD